MLRLPQRFEQLTGRPHVAGDQDGPLGGVGNAARRNHRRPIELGRAVLEVVQFETIAGAAKRIAEHDIDAGVD